MIFPPIITKKNLLFHYYEIQIAGLKMISSLLNFTEDPIACGNDINHEIDSINNKIESILKILLPAINSPNDLATINNFIKYYDNIFPLRVKLKHEKLPEEEKKALLDLYYLILARYGSFIGIGCSIKSVPILPHSYYGIFISNRAVLGSNIVIFQNVTIGSNTLGGTNKAPIIGDNCYIGAGACIIGGITIGENCRIGANCTVVESLPANSVCVAQKSRVIPHEEKLENKFTPIW